MRNLEADVLQQQKKNPPIDTPVSWQQESLATFHIAY